MVVDAQFRKTVAKADCVDFFILGSGGHTVLKWHCSWGGLPALAILNIIPLAMVFFSASFGN